MPSLLRRLLRFRNPPVIWADREPVRGELFGIDRLENHAASLAASQPVSLRPPSVTPLRDRLDDNAAILLKAYRASAAEVEGGRGVVPAAEWLLDNYHLVEEQIREIHNDLPPGYYKQLPKLADGPFAGYPRIFGIAWAYVAHTDSHFDPEILERFVLAYQRIQPLTIGELWALSITVRIVLVENLRRLADQMTAGRLARADADTLTGLLLASGSRRTALDSDIASRSADPLSERFAAQLAKRLRDQDPLTTPSLDWLSERLTEQGTTIEDVVRHAQERQGASNVTVRNIITSMRLMSDIDWADFVERISLVDERLRGASAFASMDFQTRNLYRSAIEMLSRGSARSELDIADTALEASRTAAAAADPARAEREGDPGFHLISDGRRALERTIGFRPSVRLAVGRFTAGLGIAGYVGLIGAMTAVLVVLSTWLLQSSQVAPGWLAAFALSAILPASDLATALVDRAVAWSTGAIALPALDFANGVPEGCRTLVAVPTLLTSETDLLEQIDRLEVHHLSGAGGELSFALLTDGIDADSRDIESDAPLLLVAAVGIAALNARHGPGPTGDRFFLLHRRRAFNASEGIWMGWERKRGKLHELNRLLRGADDTSFAIEGGARPPAGIRYVITLDADTRLPRDAAAKLIAKMAHPLNRAQFDPEVRRVTGGFGILQPRVTPSLPIGREGSAYQRVFSGPGGMDPYAAASSDVYQDLFGEGSYTGKGIYDVDAFEAAMLGRVPDNSLLSHDLYEGIFARAGLASDIEVVEEFPSRYDVAARRQHRWTRGDWQLIPWVFGIVPAKGGLPAVGRWKMMDNLRRSLVPPATLACFAVAWLMPWPAAFYATLLILAAGAVPAFLPIAFGLLPQRPDVRLRSHVGSLADDALRAVKRVVLTLAFLPDQAVRMLDAIVRTLSRVLGSRRHLLEWTTAAEANASPRLTWGGFSRAMATGSIVAAALVTAVLAVAPQSWPIVLPLAMLWLAAPAAAYRASRTPRTDDLGIDDAGATELRGIARRTWRFFETFVTPGDNMLPPDNFQETPQPVVAHRTSPTNIGLYMLSTVAARDFGWAGTVETVERLEALFVSLKAMTRYRGHFLNWYETRSLAVLEPAYVSSVDSGNLAGHLIALANACDEWHAPGAPVDAKSGMLDALGLARTSLPASIPSGQAGTMLVPLIDEIEGLLVGPLSLETLAPTLRRLSQKAAQAARDIAPVGQPDETSDLAYWLGTIERRVREGGRDRDSDTNGPALGERIRVLAETARTMALAMDFSFLIQPERRLLSIGYSLADNGQDANCYDLLASEARLASLFAIAKGDVATRHWFRLGRSAVPIGGGSALISWSGSMFEYLMPSLVMRAPAGSLLEQSNRLVVARQQAYGRSLGRPWGISESAYNARDIEFTYQYSNFGIPGLGLKRGLSQDFVVAPYATGLAAMVDPEGARRNFAVLKGMGALGRHGFYEAVDFTSHRLPEGTTFAVVKTYMAHHQGMTIISIANALQGGRMRGRFHHEPMIQACELLLQERVPRDVVTAQARAEEVKTSTGEMRQVTPSVRRLLSGTNGPPETLLLSNGRYAVMLTASGAGYSRWRDLAVTRWREDATRDDHGSFVFMRDVQTGQTWSPGRVDEQAGGPQQTVVFGEDHAEFTRRDGPLTTVFEVLVSGEQDGEVRRVSFTNSGRRTRIIEVTSYAEVVLSPPQADAAHPAFSKMFVQTEHVPQFGALIATRRLRSHSEEAVWAAHFAVVEGDTVADPQFETDRARFIGRGRTIRTAAALDGAAALSNSVGTVLDPIFALRRRVSVPPGKSVKVAFWTMAARTREELLDMVDVHHDRSAFDRARTLAWTQAQVQLRHLGIEPDEAAEFQRFAAPILYTDRRFRPSSDVIARGAGSQSGLWSSSISGDLPIVVLRIDDTADMNQVRQLLRAHEYWRMKRLAVDLVIINERASSYTQDLQIAIETAVRSSQSRLRQEGEQAQGAVFMLRADLISAETRALLLSCARVVTVARQGSMGQRLALLPKPEASLPPSGAPLPSRAGSLTVPEGLEFFNGIGGFDKDGREYVVVLADGRTTPAPWINVVANPGFGFHVSADGAGYTWAENSRENQITPWSNDPVSDPAGEAIFVRDEETGEISTATASPIRDGGTYIARHGFGYSRFEHEAQGLRLDLVQFVPLADPVKISRLTIRNMSDRPRRLSVTAYAEWVLGTSRGASAPFVSTSIDEATGAMLARNPFSIALSGRVAFCDMAGAQESWTGDRAEFLGTQGRLAFPQALAARRRLTGLTGAGFDPCAALQRTVSLGIGESIDVVVFLGQCLDAEQVRGLLGRYRALDLDTVLAEVEGHWAGLLGAVQVRTPDRAMDIMLNGWLLYQTIACRVMARSAFYQSSGAYGFRDQLQDGMALTFALPGEARAHLLRAAARQFVEGDVQHWWLPHSGQGVRSRISDDRVWLAFATATYVDRSGDEAVLDEIVPFLEGPVLRPGEHESFYPTMVAEEPGSLFEHCARGIDQSIALTGEHGLPLMGTGDWNDGMSRVGEGGRGESVWLGWLLVRTLAMVIPWAERRDPARAVTWLAHATLVRAALEREAWDGDWYRRATSTTARGSASRGGRMPDRFHRAVLGRPLRLRRSCPGRTGDGIRVGSPDPGRSPGWRSCSRPLSTRRRMIRATSRATRRACAKTAASTATRPCGPFSPSPSLETATGRSSCLPCSIPSTTAALADHAARYRVEPYAVAADIYSVEPHVGRGGWTWYTGAAGWMYQAGLEGILGLRRQGDRLVVDPCIPSTWPGLSLVVTVGSSSSRFPPPGAEAQAPPAACLTEHRSTGRKAGGTCPRMERPIPFPSILPAQ